MAYSEIVPKIKQTVIKKLIANDEIVNAIDSPDMKKENWIPLYLKDSEETREQGFTPHIYDYFMFPEVIDKNITFICVMVNTSGSVNNNSLTANLTIAIFTHKNHIRIENGEITDNRNDYLSQLIDRVFNGKSYDYDGNPISLGEFKLVKNIEDSYDRRFLMRQMIFTCSDINALLCT